MSNEFSIPKMDSPERRRKNVDGIFGAVILASAEVENTLFSQQEIPVLASDDRGPLLSVEQLPQPWRGMIEALSAHDDHPACQWFEKIGNGIFEDDHAVYGLPAPHPIYRFRRDGLAAYVWPAEGVWFVRPWQRMRGWVSTTVVRVPGLRAALDQLARPLRPWWRLWG